MTALLGCQPRDRTGAKRFFRFAANSGTVAEIAVSEVDSIS
jgi:hypothetical protein